MRTFHGIVLAARACAEQLDLKGKEKRTYMRNFVEKVLAKV
jgi:hypothetical protein